MTVKTERITILSTPDFKAFLQKEADNEGVSVSELVRKRCESKSSNVTDEILLMGLVDAVRTSSRKAKSSLSKGLKDAETVLAELRKK